MLEDILSLGLLRAIVDMVDETGMPLTIVASDPRDALPPPSALLVAAAS
jgi:hypothetical protein